MSWFTHEFEGIIERHGLGRERKVWYHVVFLPPHIAAELPFDQHPQLRIEGEIADIPVKSAFIPAGDGRHYVIVSPETLKDAGIGLGQRVDMRFRVADQSAVEMPDDLRRALALDGEAAAAWDALTVGRRRGLAHHVASAKAPATRERRIAAVFAAITGTARAGAAAADVTRLGRLLGKPTGAQARLTKPA